MSGSETFVDVTYHGFEIGRRLKLSDFGPTTAYLEHPTPLPVGTSLDIVTDDAGALRATVLRVHEQVAGGERVPGMHVRADALAAASAAWWQQRVTRQDPQIPEAYAPRETAVEPDPSDTDVSMPIPTMVDERDTEMMEVVTREELAAAAAAGGDKRRTSVMSVQEIRDVIGRDPDEESDPSADAPSDETTDPGDGDSNGRTVPGGKNRNKRKRKRR